VQLSLADDLPLTCADPYQLQQVFTNIINNARDALMDKKGGALTTRSARKDETLVIEFEDDGPGIKKEDIDRIFDPFFTTKEVGKGTGLGLSMSYGIIEEHGGRIDVESEPGNGTKFTVSIPIVSGRHREVETTVEKKIVRTGRRILVVDDEASIRDILSDALSMKGHIVETSSSGQEALTLIEKESFDAIIMDIKMPGMEGSQLYAHILGSHPEAVKKILFITGDTLGEDTQTFLRVSGSKYVGKPFRMESLYRTLDEVLEQ
jgi:two-component system, NtrC family, sensor kinase